MSTPHLIQTIFEICLVGFTIWAIFNEQKFIDLEEKIKDYFLKKSGKKIDREWK